MNKTINIKVVGYLDRFMNKCIKNNVFLFNINYINDEFNTDLEINSIMDSSHNLPGITKAMYQFFIIEFYNNILSIMKNYISKNSSTLYENFSELSQKKDVMTGYFKKGLSEEMSTIAANIYDVTDFIFTKLE